MAVLDAHPDRLLEDHRIGEVVAVDGDPLVVAHVRAGMVAHPAVGKGVLDLHAPGVREVILTPGAVHIGRPLLAVDHDHIVAFAPPAAVEVMHAQVAADVVPAALRLQDQVVVLVGEVHLWVGALVGRRRAGVAAPPVGVEAALVDRGGIEHVVVHVEVPRPHRHLPLVRHGDAGLGGERHWEVAVHRRVAVLPRVGRHRQHRAGEGGDLRVPDAEEVADGCLDARVLLPIPVHAQHALAQVKRVLTGDGEPDVADDACAGDVGQRLRLSRSNRPGIGVAPSRVPARHAPAPSLT